jgi:hypothetical protein
MQMNIPTTHTAMIVSLEDREIMLSIAHWIMNHRKSVKKIRQLAGTEERYMLIIREIDRLELQLTKARYLRSEATLTLAEWLDTLNHFHWRCAYCGEKSFEVMSHITPLPDGGTTVDNCVPGCYTCIRNNRKDNPYVSAYLASAKRRHEKV